MKLIDSDNAPAPETHCLVVVLTDRFTGEQAFLYSVPVSIVGTAVCVDETLYDLEDYDVVITRQLTEEDG